jgi:ribosomal-protein-alanine N-acetyltransferase
VKFVPLSAEWQAPFKAFLLALEASGDDAHFKPHPFTDQAVRERTEYRGKDFYCLLVEERQVLGYGMLRGWDEGFEVPSLGIAVHPSQQGRRLGESIMRHLHDEARERGAKTIRLRVNSHNARAIKLYKAFRYDLKPDEQDGFLLGSATL